MNQLNTNIKGQMTPSQFIQECITDISVQEIKQIIQQSGFKLNGQIISNSEMIIDFKIGDTIQFNLNDLQFNVVE